MRTSGSKDKGEVKHKGRYTTEISIKNKGKLQSTTEV